MNRFRFAIVPVLIVALVVAAWARNKSQDMRVHAIYGAGGRPASATRSSLSGMNSYALALLLGGLRGPLVMILWTSSETQKNERNLEDFDTKVEWIRLLQPEFDTVHIFQIWNKAYNISVQMASLSNKYTTILDALDYAHNVDAERPENINILAAIAQVYFDKLGNSSEKLYYRKRVREETMAHRVLVSVPIGSVDKLKDALKQASIALPDSAFRKDEKKGKYSISLGPLEVKRLQPILGISDAEFVDITRQKLTRDDPAWRRLEMDPMLDENGFILPGLLKPTRERAANAPADQEFNDGSELQYLKKYEPYPQGLSPFALSFNYYKRSQVLQTVGMQRHAQLSDLVVDSRPALGLKNWAEEEWERARRAELEAFGQRIPEEVLDMQLPTAALPLDTKPSSAQLIDDAIYDLQMVQTLVDDGLKEYDRHLVNFINNQATYRSHIDGLRAMSALCAGDQAYLKAMRQSDDARKALLADAVKHYKNSMQLYAKIMLNYYTDDTVKEQLQLKNLTKDEIDAMPPDDAMGALVMMEQLARHQQVDMHEGDRAEYDTYVRRASNRLAEIQAAGVPVETPKPQ